MTNDDLTETRVKSLFFGVGGVKCGCGGVKSGGGGVKGRGRGESGGGGGVKAAVEL